MAVNIDEVLKNLNILEASDKFRPLGVHLVHQVVFFWDSCDELTKEMGLPEANAEALWKLSAFHGKRRRE
eukprot:4586081-Karenia_brevis.AAC.1